MRHFTGRRSEKVSRDIKIRQDRTRILEEQLSGICALFIIILGLFYLSDTLRYRWTLLIIVILAIAMNAILIIKRNSGKRRYGKRRYRKR